MKRVFIFQSHQNFDAFSKNIENTLAQYLPTWKAHGKSLDANFKLLHNRFIIIEVDEDFEKPSGCSIDELTGIIRKIDAQFSLGLLDRLWLTYKENDDIKGMNLSQFKSEYKAGKISPETQIFDVSLTHKSDFDEKFLLPISESWLSFLVKN